jgi:hypothetical protein
MSSGARDKGQGSRGKSRWGLRMLAVLLFCCGVSLVWAQCPKHPVDVFELEQLYNQGRFEEIIQRGGCVDSLFQATRPRFSPTLEELTTADRFIHLYILTAYALDRDDLVEATLPQYIERFPRNEHNPERDPAAMKLAMDSLVPYNAREFGFIGGPMLCIVKVSDPQPLRHDLDVADPEPILPSYRNRMGYTFGFQFVQHLGYRHGFVASTVFSHQSWGATYSSYDLESEEPQAGDWRMEQFEHYNCFQIPLQYEYRFPLQRKREKHSAWLQFRIGAYGGALVHAETDLHNFIFRTIDGGTSDTIVQDREPTVTINSPKPRRVLFFGGLQGGIGFQMDVENFSWNLGIQAQYGLTQMRAPNSEYHEDFTGSLWTYHLAENNFWLSSLGIKAGISLPKGNKVKDLHQKNRPKNEFDLR